ncbi:MAG TPA: sarcosine oxidase subunit gamma family protein [Woeseiaceae bacterium]|nr:sarcosine oxidase subunit gamma family protein [Woeseiaceae bacterium]
MAETAYSNARRQGPLAGVAEPGGDALTLAHCPPRALLNLRCDASDARTVEALGEALGAGLPRTANRSRSDAGVSVLWLGPDEWLVMAGDGAAGTIEARLRAAAGGDPWLAVVDLSHSYAGLRLHGAATRDVLAKGCPLDLHRSAFVAGDCAQTVLAGTRVLMCCRSDDDIELWVRNSFARHAAAWLADAMAEFLA